MKQHKPTIRHCRFPVLKIMSNCVIGMRPINMEQIDRMISEIRPCLIKSRSQQGRKTGISGIMVGLNFLKQSLFTGHMDIALPSVDGCPGRSNLQSSHRLTHRTIGVSPMRSQFNKAFWLCHFHEPEYERNMADPVLKWH